MGTPATLRVQCKSGKVFTVWIRHGGNFNGLGYEILNWIFSNTEEDLETKFSSLKEVSEAYYNEHYEDLEFTSYEEFEAQFSLPGGGFYFNYNYDTECYDYLIDMKERCVVMTSRDDSNTITFDTINSTEHEQLETLIPNESEEDEQVETLIPAEQGEEDE